MSSSFLYCPDCGSKNNYIRGGKPHYCMGCGYDFESLGAFKPKQPSKPIRENQNPREDLEDFAEIQGTQENADTMDKLEGIEIEGLVDKKNLSVTLGDIISQGLQGNGLKSGRQPTNTKLKKSQIKARSQIEAEFKKDGGAGVSQPTEIG